MFIAGVIVGPALGLFVADFLFRPGGISTRWTLVLLLSLWLVVAVLPVLMPELKAGLLIGFPLGLVLATTPLSVRSVSAVEDGRT